MSIGRLEAFSDGVFAIVITLLILDIQVPHVPNGELGKALAEQWPSYVAYLLSFFIVGIIWLNHHATVNLLQRADHSVQVLNLLLLLPVSILPWPTALLADYVREGSTADKRIAVLLYGGISSLMALAFNVLWRYLLRHPGTLRPDISTDLLVTRNRRYNVGLATYPVATVVGLLNVYLFLAVMILLAVLYLLPTPDTRSD